MFLPIQDHTQLNKADIDIRQALRIARSRKKYAVVHIGELHLVNDLDRLIFDKLREDDYLYDIEIYQLR